MASKVKQEKVFLKPSEVKLKVLEFIESNTQLEKRGLLKNALSFVGEPGIAKTSSVLQVCQENNIGIEKVNMANIDDLGEITGYPMKEYEMKKNSDIQWANDKNHESFLRLGYLDTGSTRTGYAEPKWVNSLRNYEKSVLLLDDSLRSQPRFINALMDLIQRGEYYGWKLPKGCTVIMTNNPSDGDFQVAQEDSAHISRYFTFHVKYCEKSWAEQAQKENLHGAFINFILKHHSELFALQDEKNPSLGMMSMPRQWSMLFSSINHLPEFTSPKSQKIILQNGKAILPSNLVQIFTTFLHAKEWNIVEPDEIFNNNIKDEEVVSMLKKSVGEPKAGTFRNDVASILSMRITNYLVHLASTNPIDSFLTGRLKLIMENKILGSDLDFKLIKDMYSRNRDKFKGLLSEKFFRDQIIQG